MQQPLASVLTKANEGGATTIAATKSLPAHATTNHLYILALCSVAALGGFLFGFDSGVVNGAVNALSAAFGTNTAATGFAVASVLLAALWAPSARELWLISSAGARRCCSTLCFSWRVPMPPGL